MTTRMTLPPWLVAHFKNRLAEWPELSFGVGVFCLALGPFIESGLGTSKAGYFLLCAAVITVGWFRPRRRQRVTACMFAFVSVLLAIAAYYRVV